MTCSCQEKTETCTCNSVPLQACPKKKVEECGCATTELCINPKVVIPISSSEEASNKYSIETSVKQTGGASQSNVRTGVGSGDTPEEIINSVLTTLTETSIEIIRGVIGDTYTATTFATAVTSPGAPIDTITNFKNYFNAGSTVTIGTTATVPLTTTNGNASIEKQRLAIVAKIDYILDALFPVFRSLSKHIDTTETSTAICVAGSSRVYQVKVKNCLFDMKIIYN